MGYWGLFIIVMLAGVVIQSTLQGKFAKYSKVSLKYGYTGADIARKMMQDNGISRAR